MKQLMLAALGLLFCVQASAQWRFTKVNERSGSVIVGYIQENDRSMLMKIEGSSDGSVGLYFHDDFMYEDIQKVSMYFMRNHESFEYICETPVVVENELLFIDLQMQNDPYLVRCFKTCDYVLVKVECEFNPTHYYQFSLKNSTEIYNRVKANK